MPAELATGFLRSGKVRDLYASDGDRLLLIASDRISAFDVVLPTPIPDKGRVLTGLSRFWFRATDAAGIVPNHVLGTDPRDLPPAFRDAGPDLTGRLMICRRARPLPVEIIVRGYLSGSGWKDYRRTGAVCGLPLPAGLHESDQLAGPLFTPSTKAEVGHDENIDFDAVVGLLGEEVAERAREIALALYRFGAAHAADRGIILADTKFELGLVDDGAGGEALILIDEVMTPDSSRFWDANDYEPGRPQASFDKQFVRDWLEDQPWDKTPPAPTLPAEVVEGTRARYVEAFERITGASFERYLREDLIDS
ncbi:MAG: phosphoribosylaminoimidazolesuccinocarboxamide synthase [Chloroflexota bacterium]|nr:phosphoribosylaminoimidazolesuccinocarboxamide synthase [Chloroflexota bacterium]